MSSVDCVIEEKPAMNEWPMVPDWRVSQWFNTRSALSLAQLRGQVVMVHAFQMLCPGCVSHGIPQAERVHREYAGEGVAVIGLHTVFEHHEAMTPVALNAFLKEYRVTHPVGVDVAGSEGEPVPQSMRLYNLRGTPSLMLIDQAGRVRLHEFGRIDDLRLGMLLGRLLSQDKEAIKHGVAEAGKIAVPDSCDAQGCASLHNRTIASHPC